MPLFNPWTAWQADPTLARPSSPGSYDRWVRAQFAAEPEPEPVEVIAMATATNQEPTATEQPVSAAEIFRQLAAPFPDEDVRWRWADKAETRKLWYITAPMARQRLNDVLGPDGWENTVTEGPKGVRCAMTIHLPDGRSLTRSALGGYPNMAKEWESVKGGDSDAFKRAAVLFGIGAYLSQDDDSAPAPGQRSQQQARRDDRDRPRGERRPHANGDSARDDRRAHESRHWAGSQNGAGTGRGPAQAPPRRDDRQARNGAPVSGGQLWGWLKDRERDCEGIQAAIEEFGQSWGYPERMKDWGPDQVRDAYDEAREILNARD
jgi:hypothetical protein